jgi:hypothetical protein
VILVKFLVKFMLFFLRTRTSGFENFPELCPNFGFRLNHTQSTPNFMEITNIWFIPSAAQWFRRNCLLPVYSRKLFYKTSKWALFCVQFRMLNAIFLSKILSACKVLSKKTDQCTFMSYVTFIGISLNNTCLVFIQVIQRRRREDELQNIAGISKMSARIIICCW